MTGPRVWANGALLLAGLLVGLGLAEWLLRQLPVPHVPVQHMDPGLIQYDARLGWALSPGWNGVHEHEEFSARYRISADGWRETPDARSSQRWRRRTLWLGDSMTFGLGVDDAETFVNRLNEVDSEGIHLNRAVPGYSTDQQVLAFERILRRERFDRAVLVSYLANDLIDNALDYPMQAERRKPRFVPAEDRAVGGSSLKLIGVPVVLKPKPVGAPRDLGQVLLSEAEKRRLAGYGSALLSRLMALAGGAVPEGAEPPLAERVAPYARLYSALLDRWFALCSDAGVGCRVLVLPGRSLMESPESLSGLLQQALLDAVASDPRVKVLALGGETEGSLFYPKDGHLTAEGHRMVARIIEGSLED